MAQDELRTMLEDLGGYSDNSYEGKGLNKGGNDGNMMKQMEDI